MLMHAAVRFVLLLGLLVFSDFTYSSYPTQAVRIIVPYSPGGATDIAARLVAGELQAQLGQPFIVENRPGAVGLIAHREVLRAKNDGYTLLVSGSGPLSIMPFTKADVGYDPASAFTPIKLISSSPMILVVNPQHVKASTVGELVRGAKKGGGVMSYGSWGTGSPSHLATEMFKDFAGFPATHIPYKGSADSTASLLGGHVDMSFETVLVALRQITAGKLKALAVTTSERLPLLPGVPTMTEAGFPLVMTTWAAMVGPPGMPPDVVNILSNALDKALAKKDVQEKFLEQGGFVEGGSPEKYAEFLKSQLNLIAKAVKAAGITPQ